MVYGFAWPGVATSPPTSTVAGRGLLRSQLLSALDYLLRHGQIEATLPTGDWASGTTRRVTPVPVTAAAPIAEGTRIEGLATGDSHAEERARGIPEGAHTASPGNADRPELVSCFRRDRRCVSNRHARSLTVREVAMPRAKATASQFDSVGGSPALSTQAQPVKRAVRSASTQAVTIGSRSPANTASRLCAL